MVSVHWLKARCGGKPVLVNGIEARGSIQIAERLPMSMLGGETHGESVLDSIQSQMVGKRIPVTDIRSNLSMRTLLVKFFTRESAP